MGCRHSASDRDSEKITTREIIYFCNHGFTAIFRDDDLLLLSQSSSLATSGGSSLPDMLTTICPK
jgi:hypothetical protein